MKLIMKYILPFIYLYISIRIIEISNIEYLNTYLTIQCFSEGWAYLCRSSNICRNSNNKLRYSDIDIDVDVISNINKFDTVE